MPRRREGPVKNKQTGYFFFDEYVGFPPDKKRIRISLRTKDPAKAQWIWEQEYKRQWSRYYGIEPKEKPKQISFDKICKEFIEWERDIKKIKSWDLYEQRLEIVKKVWGNIPIQQISHQHLIELDHYLKSIGRAEKTINHYYGILKTLFFYANKKYKLKIENPVCDVTYYMTDRKRREYTPREIKEILEACEKIEKEVAPHALIMKYAKRITLMLLYTAMRPGELYKLRWDKHIKNDKIVLERTETKQKKEKVIPITDSIRKILNSLEPKEKGYLFPLTADSNRNKVYLSNLMKEIREKTGIEDFIFYNLKHTAASIMVSQALGKGASLEDVRKILGHSNLKTTLNYVHSDFGRMTKAMSALEDAVKESNFGQD